MQRFGFSQYCEVAKLAAAPSRLGGGDYGTSLRAKPLRAGSSPALTAISSSVIPLYLNLQQALNAKKPLPLEAALFFIVVPSV